MFGGVDVLTDVLSALKTGPTLCARTDARAPWGLRFGGNRGFGFHVVMKGTCWLMGAEEPLALGAGDVVLLSSGAEHVLADHPTTRPVTFRLDDVKNAHTLLAHRHHVGPAQQPGRADTVLLSGAYLLEPRGPHPLLAALPEVVHLPSRRRSGLHA